MLGQFRHLMVYVTDIHRSREFYNQVLDFFGYSMGHESDTYCMWNPNKQGCSFGIRVAEKRGPYVKGVAGFQHLAFSAENRDQINELHELLIKIDAIVLDAPCECPEYSPTYYAVYFEDPDGMKLELAHS